MADALISWMLERHPAIGVTTSTVNPVVCECNDGYLNDIGGRHVREQEVRMDLDTAAGAPIQEGNLGAGTGMMAYGFAGGIGTASRQLAATHGGYTLGALVLANFGRRGDLIIAGVPIGRKLEARRQKLAEGYAPRSEQPEQGSVIVLLATDAPLDARQLSRLTRRVPLGLARIGTHGGHGSGDLALAFSTAMRIPHDSTLLVQKVEVFNEQHPAMDDLFAAVVGSTDAAAINALCAARLMDGRDHHLGEALPLAEVVTMLQGGREA